MEWFKQFENPNGAIAAVQELRVRLSFDSSPANMEQALCDLAHLLGAQGSRPEKEYGEGPDDLWLWPDVSLVIEAKNQNQNTLHKDDAGQLLISLEWFKKKYPTRTDPEPVVVAKVSVSDLHAGFPDNTMVITPERMNQLLGSLETFFNRMAFQPLLASNAKSLAKMQEDLNLTPRQIVSHFTVQLEESKK
jgi:hypothetical protein